MNELDKVLPLVPCSFQAGHESTDCYHDDATESQRAADVRNLVAWLRAEAVGLEKRVSINACYSLAASSIRVRADRLEALLVAAKKQRHG